MKYFTPELFGRFCSPDEDISYEAHHEWDQAIVRYRRRWQRIKSHFPESVRRFEDSSICLHDAQVLTIGRTGETFVMVMELDPPFQDIVVLTFTLNGEPEIDPAALPDSEPSTYVWWMYEEFDLDRRKNYSLEVLLSNGWLVKVPFREFQYVLVQKIFSATRGNATQALSQLVPQPA
jgi:hypothetical protein